MSNNIEGKVVVITGASSGLGEASARYLSTQGATVVLGARRHDRIESLARELTARGGKATAVTTNVTDRQQVKKIDLIEVDDRARGVISWIEERDKAPFADDPIEPGVIVLHQFRDGVVSAPERRRGEKDFEVDDRFFALVERREIDAWCAAIDRECADAISAARVEHIGVLVELQAALFTFDAVGYVLPVSGAVQLTPYDDDHRDIGTAPVFEIVRLEEVFEAALGLADVLPAFRRLDLNAEQLAKRRAALGIAQLNDPVRPGLQPATRVVDELHFEDQLLDSGLAELA
jgi:hypothetical protein